MTNTAQSLLPNRRWTVPGSTDTPEERPFNPQTDCVVTAKNPHDLQAVGRVSALHGAELKAAGLSLFEAPGDPGWKPDPDTACLLFANLNLRNLAGQSMPLTPAEDEEPHGLDLIRVAEIVASLTFGRGKAEWTLNWPIDVTTTGMKMNRPYARVYLGAGFTPDLDDLARTLLHLYYKPSYDLPEPYPAAYQEKAFVDDAVTELASQAFPSEQAQRLILRHHFDRYVRPHLLPGIAYSIHGDRTAFDVLAQQREETG